MGAKKLERSAAEVFLESAIREGRATRQELAIRSITIDHDLQSRMEMDPEHVKHLASLMDAGIELRPVVVFRQEKPFHLWLADGFHRVGAHKARKMDSAWAWVISGGRRDALLYSVSANIENSKPTSQEDRKKAVFMLLSDEDYRNMPAAEIARRCGVNRTTVGKYRARYFRDLGQEPPAEVECEWKGKRTRRAGSLVEALPPRYYLMPPHPTSGKKSAYLVYRSQRTYLGQDSEQTRLKFEALKREIESAEEKVEDARISLSNNAQFVAWASRRGVNAATFPPGRNRFVNGIVGASFVGNVVPDLDREAFFRSWGYIRALKLQESSEGRTIIVCYPADEFRGLIELAGRDGIEFLTPEQVVAEFGPKADDAPQDPEAT